MQPVQRPYFALILRLAAAMLLSGMFLLVKLASERGIALPEIIFWRQAFSPVLLFGWLATSGGLARLKTKRGGAHALRAGVGLSNMAINFTAASLLPLAEITTLGFTTPLFAVLIAAMVLRERVGPWRWTAVLLGFAGVLVITQPGGHAIDPLGVTLTLVSAMIVAVINFQLRDLSRTEEPVNVVFWFGLFGTIVAGIAMPFVWTSHDGYEWLLLIGLGLTGLFGQLLLTASLRYGAVSTVIVMDYSSLIWAALLGWLVWSDLPTFATWLGAPLIVTAGVVIVWRQHRLNASAVPTSGQTAD